MNPRLIFGLFVMVAVVQLAVPVSQIWKHEDIQRTGAIYKFRTAPVDPYDAFRGRYVALNYEDTVAVMRQGKKLKYGSAAYVALQKDTAGFAQFGELSDVPPVKGDYLRVKYIYSPDDSMPSAHFRLPFDRYYMEETNATRAEAAYLKHASRHDRKVDAVYVSVRVKGGRGVIENLYINGKPIRDFLAEEASTQ